MLPESPVAPSPKERTMNKYQMTAFGVFAVVGLSYIVTSLYGQSVLWVILIILLVGAVLTLKTSWWLIASLVEVACKVAAAIGHVVGIIGDEIVDWCKDRKAWLRGSQVPSWQDLASDQIQDAAPAATEDSFMEGALARSERS